MADEQEISKAVVDPDAAKEVADKTTETAKDTEAGKAGKADEAEQPERDASVAGEMAALTHEQVRESPAFKGVVSEAQRLREEIKRLKEAAKPAEADAADADDDEDVFTRGDVRKIVADSNAKLREELRADFAKDNTAARQEAFQRGLDGLRADQIAGKIPMGVSTDAMMKQAVTAMKESDPEILQSLMGKPNAVRKIWDFARATVPAIAEALGKAGTIETATEKERIALGGSPEGSEPTSDVSEFIEVLGGEGD